jgi:hypothetical protein
VSAANSYAQLWYLLSPYEKANVKPITKQEFNNFNPLLDSAKKSTVLEKPY